jgi:hypothetical protein
MMIGVAYWQCVCGDDEMTANNNGDSTDAGRQWRSLLPQQLNRRDAPRTLMASLV